MVVCKNPDFEGLFTECQVVKCDAILQLSFLLCHFPALCYCPESLMLLIDSCLQLALLCKISRRCWFTRLLATLQYTPSHAPVWAMPA
jgi:hypothetical protein